MDRDDRTDHPTGDTSRHLRTRKMWGWLRARFAPKEPRNKVEFASDFLAKVMRDAKKLYEDVDPGGDR